MKSLLNPLFQMGTRKQGQITTNLGAEKKKSMNNSKKDEIQHSLGYVSVAGRASHPTEIPGLTSTLSLGALLVISFSNSPYPVLGLSNTVSWNGLFKIEISALLHVLLFMG